MRTTIIDPQGFVHVLDFEESGLHRGWHGYENIAHSWEPSQRQAIIEQVLIAAQYQRSLPWGFQYAT